MVERHVIIVSTETGFTKKEIALAKKMFSSKKLKATLSAEDLYQKLIETAQKAGQTQSQSPRA